jgi:hypothetical protein
MNTSPTSPTPTENTDIDRILIIYAAEIYKKAGAKDSDFHEAADKAKAAIEQKLTDARIQEAGLWLDMVVRHDSSRLDSNEWYKLNPQDVLKFHAERLKALQASKEGR